jgi:hypothetical protein
MSKSFMIENMTTRPLNINKVLEYYLECVKPLRLPILQSFFQRFIAQEVYRAYTRASDKFAPLTN